MSGKQKGWHLGTMLPLLDIIPNRSYKGHHNPICTGSIIVTLSLLLQSMWQQGSYQSGKVNMARFLGYEDK
jgi:hypothetical protein